MALPQIKFVWKPSISGREKWWLSLWMFRQRRTSSKSQQLVIQVRGLLAWLSAAAMAAYLALAVAWWYWLDQRPHNSVTMVDCLLAPARWDVIRHKRGVGFIDEGVEALELRQWSAAQLKLQAGLARAPDHRRGRELLAAFYLASGQRERGLKLMQDGIELLYPGRDAITSFVRLAANGEDYDTALAGLNAALGQRGAAVERDRDWLNQLRTQMLMQKGDYAAVLTWIGQRDYLDDTLQEARVVALIELDRLDEAEAAWKEWTENSGNLVAQTRIRVRLAREQQDLPTMRSALVDMIERSPLSPRPRVYAVVQEIMADEANAGNAALDDYLFRFGADRENLTLLISPLIEINAWPQVDTVLRHLREQGLVDDSVKRFEVSAAIRRGEFGRAVTLLRELSSAAPASGDERMSPLWLQTNTALAGFLATGEDVHQQELLELIRSKPFSIQFLKEVGGILEAHGRTGVGMQVLDVARRRYTGSVALAEDYERVSAMRVVNTPEPTRIELPAVRDGDSIALEAAEVLNRQNASEATGQGAVQDYAASFLRRWDELREAENWPELRRMLREVRSRRPAWLAGQVTELQYREVELHMGARDWPALSTAARFWLDGSTRRSSRIFELARELDEAGERSGATVLCNEILRAQPDFPPVVRLQQEWAAAAALRAESINAAGESD